MNSLMGRLGAFTVRRRWLVIGAWVVLLAVMASFAPRLTDRLGSGGFEVPGSQSLAVQRDLERRFANQFPTTALVTVHDEARTVDDPAFRAVVEGIATQVGAVPNVGGVSSSPPAARPSSRPTGAPPTWSSGSPATRTPSSTPPRRSPRRPVKACPRGSRSRPAGPPPSTSA
jgi:RND superfamily putative drug exporter